MSERSALLPAEICALYPALRALPESRLAALLADAMLLKMPAGAQVFSEHGNCLGFPLLLDGSIKVVKSSTSGREMLLYRVEPGGSCIITSSCLLGRSAYSARGIAESDLRLLMLPSASFDSLLADSPAFRDFVFHLFAERIAELMQLVEEVAFQRLDQRLAKLLLAKGPTIQLTHQRLAEELGSVREIVSRLLKGLAGQGLVALAREHIVVVDAAGLRRLAAGDQ
ncbi:MAG: Crp/Fnr family transcriptional regulator [Candidatus Accumulibacter sp.]|nr:Crp/Fnr family transcriptional regulator [Accumulibacter sp.]